MEVFLNVCLTMSVMVGINLVGVSVHDYIFKNRIDYWFRFYIGSVLITNTFLWLAYILVRVWI
jgi:hypothetical protein